MHARTGVRPELMREVIRGVTGDPRERLDRPRSVRTLGEQDANAVDLLPQSGGRSSGVARCNVRGDLAEDREGQVLDASGVALAHRCHKHSDRLAHAHVETRHLDAFRTIGKRFFDHIATEAERHVGVPSLNGMRHPVLDPGGEHHTDRRMDQVLIAACVDPEEP